MTNREKRIKKARNMRKNNGVGRTTAHAHMKELEEASKPGLGSKLATGFKNLLGK